MGSEMCIRDSYVVFNTKREPLNIKKFRHALAYAIDKQEIINRILLGYGEPLHSVIPPAHKFWHNPNVTKYEYNPEKAKQILDSLGFRDIDGDGYREYPNGTELELEILTLSTWPPYVRLADMLSKYWSAVGLKTKILAVEWGEESKRLHERRYDIAVWGYTVAPEPSQFLVLFTNITPYWSMGEWVNETYNELFEKQKSIMNPEERRKIIFKLQEILAEEIPILPIWVTYVAEAYRVDRYTGWIPMPMGILGIYNKLTWLNVRPVTLTTVSPVPVTVPVTITKTIKFVETRTIPTTMVTTISGVPTTIVTTTAILMTIPVTITTTAARPITVTQTTVTERVIIPTWMYAVIAILVILLVIVAVVLLLRKR